MTTSSNPHPFRHVSVRIGVLLSVLLVFVSTARSTTYEPEAGDLVFQSMPHMPLVDAIEGATGSPWSHCGIVVRRGATWQVLEAVGPVQYTPLKAWIERGREKKFAAYRLRERPAGRIEALIKAAEAFLGRPYDSQYEMDDEKLYCSELVDKAFAAVMGRPLGQAVRLGDMNWRPYEGLIRELEGGGLPLDREIVSPRALTESPEVTKVY